MKCIGFIGKTNKSEMVQYVAKIISSLGNKVMVIDATTAQRTRYTVPTILGTENQNQYIVQYDSVEIAVGFNNMLELKKYSLTELKGALKISKRMWEERKEELLEYMNKFFDYEISYEGRYTYFNIKK